MEWNGLPWKHFIENQWGAGEAEIVWEEGVGEAETECLILWLVVLELLVGGWWWLPDDLSNMFTLST